MLKKIDNFLDRIINKIKELWNSGEMSLYDFVSSYEKHKINEDKEIDKLEADLKKIEETIDKPIIGMKRVDTYKRNDQNQIVSCLDLNSFEPMPSPYHHNYNYQYSCASCSCSYEIPPYINHQNDRCNVLNRNRVYKIFYKNKYKNEENYLKAIEKFYKAY